MSRLHEFILRFNDSSTDDLVHQDADPNPDLVKPTGMGKSEGEGHPVCWQPNPGLSYSDGNSHCRP
jgi:hypothetical protein